VITREDLDRFIRTFAPDAPEAFRGRMAVQYARTLAFAGLAEQQGLAKKPAVSKELELQLKLLRMRVLANAFLGNLDSQPAPTGSQAERYYQLHRDQYQQVSVRRLAVPLAVPTENGRPLDRSAVLSELEELRKRALAGEDLNDLQQVAFKDLHIQAPPPPVTVQPLNRNVVQGEETKLFQLKAGDISAVLDLPAAYVIAKIESNQTAPLDIVRPEIEAALRRDRVQNGVEKLTKTINADFNLAYLGLASQPDMFAQTSLAPAPARAAALRPASRLRR
jgi:hypothetical protein